MIGFFIILIIAFVINPFVAFVIAWLVLFRTKLTNGQINVCLLIISAYWGLLSFTQKSLADIDTDVIRYYYSLPRFVGLSVEDALSSLNIIEMVQYVFAPTNAIIVSLTGNVQSISFLWPFVTYICTYYSIWILLNHFRCYNQKNLVKILFIVSFCFMLFVQISELLKQAAAFAVIFYGLTLYISRGINVWSILLIIISIGIHSSMFLCLPLFCYKLVSTKTLIIILAITTPIFMFASPIEILFSIFPSGQYFYMLSEKYGNYGDGQGATPHYILIELLMLCMAIDLWRRKHYKNDCNINIILIYFLISFANFNNIVAFLRFALFSHWIYAFILVQYINVTEPQTHFPQIVRYIIIIMFFMSLRFTMSRLGMGIYPSSYMDNSLIKITTSTVADYLNFKYDK